MKINTEKTEVALKAASTEINIFVVDAQKEVKALQNKYGGIVPIATDKKGYDHCKEVRKDLMPIKTKLENARKTLKAPILEAGKLIDSAMRPLIDVVDELYKPFEAAYRAIDEEKKNREAVRQEKINSGLRYFDECLVSAAGSSVSVIEVLIDELADFSIDRNVFMEKSDDAAMKHSETMQKLADMLRAAIEHAEIIEKQAAMEKRERELERREAEFKQKEEAEQLRINAQAAEVEMIAVRKAATEEANRVASERYNQQLAIKVEEAERNERAKIELAQENERIENEKREANKKHKAAIHKTILNELLNAPGTTESQCRTIIKLVASKSINNISINY